MKDYLYEDYIKCLCKWIPFSRKHFYYLPDHRELACYGTGYDEWGIQTCQKAYAWLCAEKLSADCTLVSKSGAGIISGYTPDGVRNTGNLLAPVYDRAGCSEGKTDDGVSVEDIAWNGGEEPDIVVVNLGTNDVSYCFPGGGFNAENISDEEKRAVCYDGEGILTKTQQEKINEIRCSFFYNEYRKFLKTIRNDT